MNKKFYKTILQLILIIFFLFPYVLEARVKLVALPERGAIVIRLDHTDGAFIEEERTLSLKKGLNKIDFSWKDVRIDPDSIQLLILTHPKTVQLLNINYPSDENSLVWEINSLEAGDEKVRICYLLENLDHLIDYRLIVNKEETIAHLQMSLIVRNFSGEKFTFANIWLGYGKMIPISIDNGETKKILLEDIQNITFEKEWEWDSIKESLKNKTPEKNIGIPVIYSLSNSNENGLGKHTLSQGKVRVFQECKNEQSVFLGEDKVKAVPVGEKMRINIGRSFDISIDQRKMKTKKINIRNNNKNRIVLYDTNETIATNIKNFKTKPAKISIIQSIKGQWEIAECNIPFTLKSASELLFEISLLPLEKKELSLRFNRRNIQP